MRSVKREELRVKSVAFGILFLTLCSSLLTHHCSAQTAGKYEFYRYNQAYAVQVDPLGQILGRLSVQFEDRLDPNFTRAYEFVYQKNVEDKHVAGAYPESAVSLGAIERIYLVDNAAMLGLYVGIGGGIGMTHVTGTVRLTAEIGYKYSFGGGIGHFFIEPRLIMDSYLITNHVSQRVLPYVSLPFGYAWW